MKKIVLVIFALVFFSLTAYFWLKEQAKESAEEAKTPATEEAFTATALDAAQNLKFEDAAQENIFEVPAMDEAVNKEVPAEEEGQMFYQKGER